MENFKFKQIRKLRMHEVVEYTVKASCYEQAMEILNQNQIAYTPVEDITKNEGRVMVQRKYTIDAGLEDAGPGGYLRFEDETSDQVLMAVLDME